MYACNGCQHELGLTLTLRCVHYLLHVYLSVHVGTRYKRRGVDAEGHVANHVETEMLIQCGIHIVSYVVVRGSVPIYWTQPGYKYRPPPIIEKGTYCATCTTII